MYLWPMSVYLSFYKHYHNCQSYLGRFRIQINSYYNHMGHLQILYFYLLC